MAGIGVLALGGSDTIGGNKLVLRFDGSHVLLDFGTNFKKFGTYYEEYLRPRSAGGLLDYVEMGVLPDARNLYRDDLMHPELELKGHDLGAIDLMLLSHAHADHFGDMGFLRTDIPVATNAISAAIIKAMSDSGKADMGKDYVCPSPRYRTTFRGTPVVQTCSVKEARERGMCGRDFVMLDGRVPRDFEEFWGMSPAIELADSPNKCRPHLPGRLLKGIQSPKVTPYPVDHSVKGATAHVIPTSAGNVIYTGDLRMHGMNRAATAAFLGAARSPRPYAMIVEGTRVGRSSDDDPGNRPPTEEDVLENARQMVSGMGGELVIADFGPRNIERLETFLAVARENHRKLVITTKDAYLLHAMHSADPKVPIPGPDMLIYDSPKGGESKFEEYVLDRAYPGDEVKGRDIGRSPGDYLLSFSFFDLKHLVDIKPARGHYLYSSCEAFSEEQEIDFIRMGAWLGKYHLDPKGLSFGKDEKGRPKPEFPREGSIHASGHASKEDLVRIVETIDPEVVIPVHTEATGLEWFKETFGGQRRVETLQEGEWKDI
ncbi:MAG: MBL fold metallo-hydrolase RNA specificity domain-containing protein [Candidatus Thermoplasmatota archaeon]